jgi:hypothetical protein
MFVQEDSHQADPNVMPQVMKQLSLMGCQGVCGNDIGNEAATFLEYAQSKQSNSNQSIGTSYQRLSARWCWKLTCFSRKNKMDSSMEGLCLVEKNKP